MLKCSVCGFENDATEVCTKCGSLIQKYIKALPLNNINDVPALKEKLAAGNVLIVNVLPFIRGKKGVKSSTVLKLRNTVEDLTKYALSIGGDVARIGEERIILALYTVQNLGIKASKPANLVSKQDVIFRKCPLRWSYLSIPVTWDFPLKVGPGKGT